MKRGVVFIAALLLTCTAGSMMAQRRGGGPGPANPFLGNEQAAREGETLYGQHCTTCHGSNGGGGEIGPAIVSSDRAALGVNDAQTFNTIKNGVPGTPMSAQKLTDDEIWKITTYIHALRGTALDSPVQGDVAHGEEVFFGKGQCGNCHMLKGKGGLTAPDLTNIAAVRKSSTITAALTKEKHKEYGSGGAHLSTLPPDDRWLPVHVTTADGKVTDGVLLNEDSYSIQMIGNDQQLHLFDRTKLKRVVIDPKSLMPTDYDKRLTAVEFKDLMAFLTRQGTVPPPAPARRGGGPPPDQQ